MEAWHWRKFTSIPCDTLKAAYSIILFRSRIFHSRGGGQVYSGRKLGGAREETRRRSLIAFQWTAGVEASGGWTWTHNDHIAEMPTGAGLACKQIEPRSPTPMSLKIKSLRHFKDTPKADKYAQLWFPDMRDWNGLRNTYRRRVRNPQKLFVETYYHKTSPCESRHSCGPRGKQSHTILKYYLTAVPIDKGKHQNIRSWMRNCKLKTVHNSI